MDKLIGQGVTWRSYKAVGGYECLPAVFLGWGCDYEEFDNGPGNYTAAILMTPDGQIRLIHARLVSFGAGVYSQVKAK
jgi:hypothetical protein